MRRGEVPDSRPQAEYGKLPQDPEILAGPIDFPGSRADPSQMQAERVIRFWPNAVATASEQKWQTGEPFDLRLVDLVLGIESEALPPYGMARAAVYRWTFPDASREEATQWLKRIDLITDYEQLRILSYGLPRPELLRDSPFVEDPWDTKVEIERIAASRDEQGPTLVVSLAGFPGERLSIYPSGKFVYKPSQPKGTLVMVFPSGC